MTVEAAPRASLATVELTDAEILDCVEVGEGETWAFEAFVGGRWLRVPRVRVVVEVER